MNKLIIDLRYIDVMMGLDSQMFKIISLSEGEESHMERGFWSS